MSKSSGKQTGNSTRAQTDPVSPASLPLPPLATPAPTAKALHAAERDMNAAQRETLAVSLRMQGYEFEAIAEQCGYVSNGRPNASAAYKAWKRALARMPRQAIEESRTQMVQAYNAIRQQLLPECLAGDTEAIKAWIALDERHAKLLGLDVQPKKDQVAAPKVVIRSYGAADNRVNMDLL